MADTLSGCRYEEKNRNTRDSNCQQQFGKAPLPAPTPLVIRYSQSLCAVGRLVFLSGIRQPDRESDHRKFEVPEYVVLIIQNPPPPLRC